MIYRLILLAITLFVYACGVSSDEQAGPITSTNSIADGEIVSSSGEPKANARVYLNKHENNQLTLVDSTFTDKSGYFAFSKLAEGKYSINSKLENSEASHPSFSLDGLKSYHAGQIILVQIVLVTINFTQHTTNQITNIYLADGSQLSTVPEQTLALSEGTFVYIKEKQLDGSVILVEYKVVKMTDGYELEKQSNAEKVSSIAHNSSIVTSSSSISSSIKASSESNSHSTLSITLTDLNSKDANITKSGKHSDLNFGQAYSALIGSYDANTNSRYLLQFDIPSELTGKTIVSATLKHNIYRWFQKDTTHDEWKGGVHQMLVNWKEGNGDEGKLDRIGETNSAGIDGTTGNEAWFGQNWKTPLVGLDNIEAQMAMMDSVEIKPDLDTEFSFDITKAVKVWVEDSKANYGLLIRDLREYPATGREAHTMPDLYTSEDPTKSPVVEFTYY